jgi:hypothetical protein
MVTEAPEQRAFADACRACDRVHRDALRPALTQPLRRLERRLAVAGGVGSLAPWGLYQGSLANGSAGRLREL